MTFCLVGADAENSARIVMTPGGPVSTKRRLTMADGVRSAVVTFKEVLKVVEGRQPMPHMRQLVASYTLGESTLDKGLCQQSFHCERPPSHMRLRPVGKVIKKLHFK